MNANTFLNEASQQAVLAAVARAERRTAAEVVCVVATESGRYDRAEAVVGIGLGLLALAGGDAAWGALAPSGSWGAAPAPVALVALWVAAFFIAGNVLASFWHPLRRAFVSKQELEEEVARAAASAFTRQRVADTKGRTGVLVYVSLFERRVVVLLDTGARAVAGEAFAGELCAKAVAGLAAGGRGEVLVGLIDATADALAAKLPRQPGSANELPDRVVLLHPR